MAEAEIQALLDAAGADIGVGIALGDVEDRVLAHTVHGDLVDDVRLSGILHRRTYPEVLVWFEQWGIREAITPVRTPADESLGILARWCVPVRFRGTHLGYIWVLDAGRLTEDELRPVLDAADQIAALIYRRRLASRIDSDLLRHLLIPSPENDGIAAEILRLSTYNHKGPVAVVVAGTADGGDPSQEDLSDLTVAVQRTAEQALPGTVLAGTISGLGVLLAPLRHEDNLAPARRLAEILVHLASHASNGLALVAGIGTAGTLEQASHSYTQARRTLRLLRTIPDLGTVAAWEDLGVFRAVALVSLEDDNDEIVDRRVRSLLRDANLATTAETFLDLAGNVQETANQLYLHRTTLYQRLDRIATVYGLDLRHSGDHRLITHLGLKIARAAHL